MFRPPAKPPCAIKGVCRMVLFYKYWNGLGIFSGVLIGFS
jgi:hypothetical protein